MDLEFNEILLKEQHRQKNVIDLIASENRVSKAVLEASGSILTNKYAEGFPNKRYYGGCQYVDEIEILAQERCKKLFNCKYANVQPHSGSQANQAVFLSLLNPGDTILGMSLECGGHLTHGASKSMSGLWFNAKHYGVDSKTGLVDYNEVRDKALLHKPKLIIAGFSAYSRILDWQKFKDIADEVGAYLMADIAHVAGLVATGYYPTPIGIADVVTSTTHKTLRGPRGGIILTNNEELSKKINSALFPGIQGGPLMHIIGAKAVAFGEALSAEFKTYIAKVCENAKSLSDEFLRQNISVVSGGTDNHLVLLDLSQYKVSGKQIEYNLGEINIVCNKNTVPGETLSPFITSGIRLGTPAMTTLGLSQLGFRAIAKIISDTIKFTSDASFELEKESLKKAVENTIRSI